MNEVTVKDMVQVGFALSRLIGKMEEEAREFEKMESKEAKAMARNARNEAEEYKALKAKLDRVPLDQLKYTLT